MWIPGRLRGSELGRLPMPPRVLPKGPYTAGPGPCAPPPSSLGCTGPPATLSTLGGGPLRAPTRPFHQNGAGHTGKALEPPDRDAARSPSRPAPPAPPITRAWTSRAPSLEAPQAHLVLGHSVKTGQVRRQHQVPLDSPVELHQDGAVLRGAAVRRKVHLRARRQACEGGRLVQTAPSGSCPTRPQASP